MGGGSYSSVSHYSRADNLGYFKKSTHEIFKEKTVNNAMNPFDVKIRESRDSKEHPESLAIIIALDVTGSMGSIPHHLIKEGLSEIMDNIIQSGMKDPQILFLGIGDHECDCAPLQVGQFESSDELLDKWLTTVFLEGGGGGNGGESYFLAWYFAAHHTSIDCFEKRKQKGFLFTIGDEPVLKKIQKNELKSIMGNGQYEDYSAMQLLDNTKEKYNIYHLHIRQGSNGNRQDVIDGWKQIIGDNLLIIENHKDISKIIPEMINKNISKKSTFIKENKKEEREEIIL